MYSCIFYFIWKVIDQKVILQLLPRLLRAHSILNELQHLIKSDIINNRLKK